MVSGGVESCVLLGELALSSPRVVPFYMRFGLVWEEAEQAALERYLDRLRLPSIDPLRVLESSLAQAYAGHWSLDGHAMPIDDADVYLPGRNMLLLTQPAIWCHRHGIRTLALGTLAGNPFLDATPAFFEQLSLTVNLALGAELRFERPYEQLTKEEVIRRGGDFPLEESFSCVTPVGMLPCGKCNKCQERRDGFLRSGLPEPTHYATTEPIPPSNTNHRRPTVESDV
ncbi:7-cyano-7-deazaguanine synthase [Kolteria novifilia]